MIDYEGLWVYDFEVLQYDWLLVIKNHVTKEKYRFWNASEELQDFFEVTDVDALVGYNNKGYDKYILAGCFNELTNEEIKEINDHIIGGGNGFDLGLRSPVNKLIQIDLMNDVRIGTSLKSIEAHLGRNIVESSISFDLDRPLTTEEAEEMFRYCEYDVDMTDELIDIRADYLETKIELGKRCNLNPFEAMSMTNAKLTARLLGATKQTYPTDERYELPEGVDFSDVPTEIIDFFKSLDGTTNEKLLWEIPGCTLTYSDGGVHGSAKNADFEFPASKPILCTNDDVGSLYPSLLDLYGYISRSCANPNAYHDLKVERLTAKANGDTKTASYLKSPLNATSGAQDSEFNELYDPRTRFMRYTGQLLITIYIYKLMERVPDVQFINVNTDGVAFYYHEMYQPIVEQIREEWQKETRLILECDSIVKICLKDVNNLMFIKANGKVKYVGGELTRGITNKGAMAINNNMVAVRDAVLEYLAHDVPVEETIRNCKDILKFQQIAKVSHKYSDAIQIVDGQEVPTQRCNRVYATKDASYGTLYKKNKNTGNWKKMEGMPEHSIIDNDNHLTIDDIDLNYYIDKAQTIANKFKGDNTMATTTVKNIYQKLADLREDFYKSGLKKTGVNSHAEFKYFKLDDIIPIAHELFKKHKVVFITNVNTEIAEGILRDLESEESITTTIPVKFISTPEKYRMNEAQANSAVVTYSRKSLYFSLFDIMEGDDDVEQATPKKEVVPTVTPIAKPSKPMTAEQRSEVKAELTEGGADEMLLKALKVACQKLLKVDKEKYKGKISKIQVATKKFTSGNKADVEKWIKQINAEVAKNG